MTAEAGPRAVRAAVDAGAVLVDVREPEEWNAVRIPGAVLIPLATLPDHLADLPEDRDVYVHCRSGGRSERAVEWLRANGRPRAVNVTGGIRGWVAEGLGVEPEGAVPA